MGFLSKIGGAISGGLTGFLNDGPLGGLAGAVGGLASSAGLTDQNKANSAQALRQMNFQSSEAQISRRHSAKQAQKQMKFQKMMSSTAHQRQIKDLKKAGLNPILAAGGGGSSTPSGAMGATSAPSGAQASETDEATPAIHSAMSVLKTKAEIKNIAAQTDLTEAQKDAIQIKAKLGEAGGSVIESLRGWGTSTAEAFRHSINQYKNRYKHGSVHNKYRGKIDRSPKAKAFPYGSKPHHSKGFIPDKSSVDYNPHNSDGLHYWNRRKGWMTLKESKAHIKSTRKNWN